MGKARKCRARENRGGRDKKEKEGREMIIGSAASPGSPQFPPVFFFFVFAFSQFRGPDYLGAWNRLLSLGQKKLSFLER